MLHEDETLSVVREGAVIVAVWRDAPTVDQLRRLFEISESARSEGSRLGFLNIVVSGTPRFSNEVRREAKERIGSGGFDASAHVIVLPGFAGSAVRAFLSTVNLLARPGGSTKIFGDLEQGATWLAGALDLEDPEPMLRAARRVRGVLDRSLG